MQITRKQRNVIWCCVVLLVGVYYAPDIARTLQRVRFQQAMAQEAKKQAMHPTPQPIPQPQPRPAFVINGVDPNDKAAIEQFKKLTGKWVGAGVIEDRGVCHVGLEMKFDKEHPGDYSGFTIIACSTQLAMLKHRPGGDLAKEASNAMIPTDLIMRGAVKDATIRFAVQSVIGPSPDCKLTDLQVTPFGTERIAVQWQGQKLTGGYCEGSILMQRDST